MATLAAVETVPAQSDSRQSQPLVVLAGAFCAGIVLDRHYSLGVTCWLLLSASTLASWWLAWRRRYLWTSAAMLATSAVALGGARHFDHWNLYPSDSLALAATQYARPVCVEAIAAGSVRRRAAPPSNVMSTVRSGELSRVLVSIQRVRCGRQWQSASGKAQMYVDGQLLNINGGDRLRIFALMKRAPPPDNPHEVDFAQYRRAERVLLQLRAPHLQAIQRIETASLWSWRYYLGRLRESCRLTLHHYLEDRQAALAAAVLLGAREEVEYERAEPFLTTGTIHLLAISGLHVGMLAGGLWWLMQTLGASRRSSLWLAALLVIAYAVLVDARPPVIRAAILTATFFLARLSGRRSSAFNVLGAAMLFLLVINPTTMFRVGAQLSFLAVGTIVYAYPRLFPIRRDDPLGKLLANSRSPADRLFRRFGGQLCKLFLISAAVWSAALPLTMYHFHLFTPVALVLNPFAWLPLGGALFCGFGVLLTAPIAPIAADVLGFGCNASLSVLETIVAFGDRVPGGHYWVPGPPAWWLLVFYSGLGILAAFPAIRLPRGWQWALLLAWIAVGIGSVDPLVTAHVSARNQRLACTFLSVGHGTCAVIELPGGKTFLYDAGSMGDPRNVSQTVARYLWSRGVTHLDAILLTHADVDHYNAVPCLLERFSIGCLYVSPTMFDSPDEATLALQHLLINRQVRTARLHAGQRLVTHDDAEVSVLHPGPNGCEHRADNENSVVLAIEHAQHRILLTGDLEVSGLAELLEQRPTRFDVVMAPHHGSGRSDPPGLAAWARPKWAIISGCITDYSPTVEQAYSHIGAEVLATWRDGAIQVVSEDDRITVASFRRTGSLPLTNHAIFHK